MVKAKRDICSLLIAILLMGVVNIPIAVAENKSDESMKISDVEKSATKGIIYDTTTKDKMSMNGYLYITVEWQREFGVTTITGVKEAWTTDPDMELLDAWSSSTYARAYFWDDTHHVGDHIIIDASELE